MNHTDRNLPKKNLNPLKLDRSKELSKIANNLVGGFTQSMMKKPDQFALGHFPVFIEEGNGSIVTDVDGNEYIDFICGLAANTLGHNSNCINRAILSNLNKGILHSLPTEIELEASKEVLEVIPNGEMIRFFKTGADSTSAAIRLSRHLTKKEKIITTGYNGWHDHFMFDTPGVPENIAKNTIRQPLFTEENEKELFDKIAENKSQLACVLLTVPYNRILSKDFMNLLREITAQNDVLLVFDEVMTGFRLALGGCQEYFKIDADLVCLSKGIAGGMPLSAVVGSKKYIDPIEELQVSTTFGGEMLSLAVCKAVIKEYKKTNYIEHIDSLGFKLKNELNSFSKSKELQFQIVGYNCIPLFMFSKNLKEQATIAEVFLAKMASKGILLRRDVNFICNSHEESQIDYTISAASESLLEMKKEGTI